MSTGYSVLLLYPDYIADDYGGETFYAWVDPPASGKIEDVIKEAQRQAAEHNASYFEDGDHDPADFRPLLVIKGHHTGEYIP